jgi:hydrogenase expression/formation protein HypD
VKFLDEYRDGELAQQLAREIHRITTKPWNIMEVCGGQTHAIVKFGIDELLPKPITLIHGPGCPVCVTPLEMIDKALEIASRPGVIFTSFGDMLRVPGSTTDLLSVKAKGGDVRIVYSPLDAVKLAEQNPAKEVVFFGVGFETTAPATAMAGFQAAQKGLKNFSMLISHVLVPPAIEALMSSPNCRVQAFLAAGHVCAIMGYEEYPPLAARYRVPIVVTGFEPLDVLQGILMCVQQLESGRAEVETICPRRAQGGQSAGAGFGSQGVQGRAAQVAGCRRDSRERSGLERGLRGVRCGAEIRPGGPLRGRTR